MMRYISSFLVFLTSVSFISQRPVTASDEEVARLKARVERLEAENMTLRDEIAVAKRPDFTIVALQTKNYRGVGVQHRYARVVLRNPMTKDHAEQILKAIYSSYEREIQDTQPDAKYKRIGILLYNSIGDAEDDDGGYICRVKSSNTAESRLPAWEKARIDWKWRDSEFRPTDRQLRIYREYWRALMGATASEEVAFEDAREEHPTIDGDSKLSITAVGKKYRVGADYAAQTARQLVAEGFGELREVVVDGGALEEMMKFTAHTGIARRAADPRRVVKMISRLLAAQKKDKTTKNLYDSCVVIGNLYTDTAVDPSDVEPLVQEMPILASVGVKEAEALVVFSMLLDVSNRTEAAFQVRNTMVRLAAVGTPAFKEVEEREKKEIRSVVSHVCERHDLTKAEMQQNVAYVSLWHRGEKPSSERVNEWIKSFYADWTD